MEVISNRLRVISGKALDVFPSVLDTRHSRRHKMTNQPSLNLDEFSLTKGGLFFKLLVWMHLMNPDLAPTHRRAVILALFTWLPLLILSAFQGLALGGPVKIPFLFDFPVSVRLLLSLPLLILAESVIDVRIQMVVKHFIQSGLVRKNEHAAFESSIQQFLRMWNSLLAEGVIAGLVIFSAAFLRLEFSGTSSTWQFLVSSSGATRTLAGWWHVLVCIPVVTFLMFRWVWRYLIWCWFLWRTSRLDLHLVPTHPDMAAGLGFLGLAQVKYTIIIFALSSLLSSQMGQEILFGGASLANYKTTIFGFVALVLIISLGPLLVFSPKLFDTKRKGLLEYGALANEYTQSFERKWIRREAPEGEALIGSADIQSLADLGNSFEIVRKMRPAPFDLATAILPMVAAAAIPFLPLALTVFPLEEILKKVIGMLL
jgi:hypothetical protein